MKADSEAGSEDTVKTEKEDSNLENVQLKEQFCFAKETTTWLCDSILVLSSVKSELKGHDIKMVVD